MGRRDTNERVRLQAGGRAPAAIGLQRGLEPVPEPGPNEVLVRTRFLSVDPYMGEQIRGSWPVGELILVSAVSQVVKSTVDAYGSLNKKR